MTQELRPWRKKLGRRSALEIRISVLQVMGVVDRMTHVYYITNMPSTKVKSLVVEFLKLGLIEPVDETSLQDKRLVTYYKRTARGDEALALWSKLKEMIGCQE